MAISFIILIAAVSLLAYSNGANDNFKGVATLFGSGTASYKKALAWATVTTFAGSVASIFFLTELLGKRFSGKGFVPDAIAVSPTFLQAVAIGAGLTVILATVTGFPISTTHSLTGALVGGGLVAVGTQVNWSLLGSSVLLPLLLSPLIAISLGLGVHFLLQRIRARAPAGQLILRKHRVRAESIKPDNRQDVVEAMTKSKANGSRDKGARISPRMTQELAHYGSAGVVGFARGLNDTPKIAALLLSAGVLGIHVGMIVVALVMAIGGLLNSRKVANTMSKRITRMNSDHGFAANIATGTLVILASQFGLPVSTTHVSVGSLFGVGLITKKTNANVVRNIVFSWVLTLPMAAILSGGAYWLLNG